MAAYPQQAPAGMTSANSPLAQMDYFLIQRKFVALGNKYYIKDGADRVVAFCAQKILTLKEDIRIHTDENQTQEVLAIRQRQILDFAGTFDVFDSATQQLLGTWQRKGFSSFLQDEWKLSDPWGRQIGRISETGGMAILTRILGFLPKQYFIEVNGVKVGSIHQRFSLFVQRWDVRAEDPGRTLDRRLLLTGALLMDAIERAHKQ